MKDVDREGLRGMERSIHELPLSWRETQRRTFRGHLLSYFCPLMISDKWVWVQEKIGREKV